VLSIRRSRTVGQDHTVSWEGIIYGIARHQAASGMRGARVQIERRLDGSTWMRWRNHILRLERCQVKPAETRQNSALKHRATQERSPQEKALARQRFLQGRRNWQRAYERL